MTSSEKCIVKNDDGYVDEEKTVDAIASALADARKRERERVREAVEKAFGGEPYLYHEVCTKVLDSLSEPEL